MTNADVSFGEHPRFYIYGIPIARKKHKNRHHYHIFYSLPKNILQTS